jgi:hypothetical protein
MRYLLVFFLFVCNTSFAQRMELSWVRLSDIEDKAGGNHFSMHDGLGPYALFKAVIVNDRDEVLTLEPNNAEYYVTFKFDGELYKQKLVPMPFMDYEILKILPNDTVGFEVGTELFYGTKIFNDDKENYNLELIKALPTIKLFYHQDSLRLNTSGVGHVYIKNNSH